MKGKPIFFLIFALAVIGYAVYLFSGDSNYLAKNTSENNVVDVVEVDPIANTIWNAYNLSGTMFIYPADWDFSETKTLIKNKEIVTGFEVSITDNDAIRKISVSTGCDDIIESETSTCVGGFKMTANTDDTLTMAVFKHMREFLQEEQSR